MRIPYTWLPEDEKVLIHNEAGKIMGAKWKTIGHLHLNPYYKYDAYAIPLFMWEQINDGTVEVIEAIAPGKYRDPSLRRYAFVDDGSLQYTITIKDALQYGQVIDTPGGKQWAIPLQYCKRAQWKEEPKGDIAECQAATTTPSTAS